MAFRTWVKDATLTAQVQYKLSTNRSLNADNIQVEAEDGVVVLRGEVPGISDRSMAELVTRNTEGVEAVRNLLNVAN
jgi:osmotically-inducible protein OsmY